MDQTCGTCRFWSQPIDPDAKGLCVHIRGSGFHRSEKAEPRVWEPPLILRLLNRRLTLELHTAPDFACSEWRAFEPD